MPMRMIMMKDDHVDGKADFKWTHSFVSKCLPEKES